VSGTLRLPLERVFPGIESADPAGELAAVMRTLRDIEYHPEHHVELATLPGGMRELVASKQRWIDTVPTPALSRRRCHEIRAANQALAGQATSKTSELAGRVAALEAAERARQVLWARTHPWCFFPEKMLREFLLLENA
jgi:hypothetical protein